jgi:hypothetical protein
LAGFFATLSNPTTGVFALQAAAVVTEKLAEVSLGAPDYSATTASHNALLEPADDEEESLR